MHLGIGLGSDLGLYLVWVRVRVRVRVRVECVTFQNLTSSQIYIFGAMCNRIL